MKQPWFETSGWHTATNAWFSPRAIANVAERPEAEERREPEPTQEPDRAVAPPIEREHETYAGIFEEDERRTRRNEPAALG